MEEKLLKSIEGKKNKLDSYRPLSQSLVNKLNEQIYLEWTYNSNAIEGNTLSIQETEMVLREGITIGNKSLREHFEVINHNDSIKYLEEVIKKKTPISAELIRSIHQIILKNIDDEQGGMFRKGQVRIVGSRHLPPNPLKIYDLIEELISWYFSNQKKLSIPELSALFHFKLVHIHPFIDGNGRTARLLMNLILMQKGFPPAVILNVDRKKYYRVFRKADTGETEDFENFIGRSIERSLIIYLNTVEGPKEKGSQGYISLKEATKHCKYSMEYLSFLARTGKLSAIKFNRNWMTTIEAIKDYSRENE
jgi:Fic family protein